MNRSVLLLVTLSALTMGCGNDGVPLQTWWGPIDVEGEASPFPPGGSYGVQGFAHRVQTTPATGNRDLVEVILVGALQDVSCDAYTRFLYEVREIQTYVDEVRALGAEQPDSWKDYVCQELDGVARDAFGGDGVYRATHILLDVSNDAAPDDGVFRAAAEGGGGDGFGGGELLTAGSYVSRIYERARHGEGILPDSAGSGSSPWHETDLNPATDCESLLTTFIRDAENASVKYPDRASMALQAATNRYYHHYKSQEVISIKGQDRPLGVMIADWANAGVSEANAEVTLFGQVSRVQDIFPYQQVLVSTQAVTVPLAPCGALNEVAGLVWPEVPGLLGTPASVGSSGDDDDSAGDDDDSAGDDDDSAL